MSLEKKFKKELRQRFAKDYKEYYPSETLESLGFMRKSCACGHNYWTLDADRNSCGDTNCEGGYQFIGNPPTTKRWGYQESWEEWVDFFSKLDHSHTPIPRYSTVSRWRDDSEFTAASIYDFQPHVVSGIIDPPANPLLVPQFCLRFNDIDNVGWGRHYSLFIMVGQHAFNKPGEFVYFKDKCVEYDYRWIVEGVGIQKDDVTFIEDAWSGGGNFGPCMEYFSSGLELGNAVFMEFQNLPEGGFKELEMKIVDMGSGLERYPWITHGSATSYDSVFPYVLKKMQVSSGISPSGVWNDFAPLSNSLNIDEVDDIHSSWVILSEKTGLSINALKEELEPMVALYSIAEHARALLVAITDGALPSNIGGGYNLRYILRRSLNLLEKHQIDFSLEDVMDWHIDELSGWFPELKEARDGSLFDIISVERNRHKKTIQKGRKKVKSLLKRSQRLDPEALVDLYDSQGISPEVVQGIAKDMDIIFEIPPDFSLLIQERHDKSTSHVQPPVVEMDRLSGFPTTQKLYYEGIIGDSYAKILGFVDNRFVILDKTIFYPEGGGQMADFGFLGEWRVNDVKLHGGVVVHELDLEGLPEGSHLPKVGEKVQLIIDLERRMAITRHHTATHILNAAVRKVLGNHIWQAGAHKTPERARLDVTHYQAIDAKQKRQIERIANEIVLENRPIKINSVRRDNAENKYGVEIYQGGAIPGREIRIVDIGDWDTEACGGTHCNSTSEVGLIKIVNTERIQDGVVRINFLAGFPAFQAVQEQETDVSRILELWSIPRKDLVPTAQRFFEEWKSQKKQIERMTSDFASLTLEEALKGLKDSKEVIIARAPNVSQKILHTTLEAHKKEIKEKKLSVILVGADSALGITGNDKIDIKRELEKLCEVVKGNSEQAQGFRLKLSLH